MEYSKKKIMNKVLLAIPVYNEEKHLDAVMDEVGHYIDNVVVIDDGSTDNSREILARRRDVCVVSHKHNCGYGSSIIHTFQFAQGCGFDWVITMDCDLQHEPRQIPSFLEAIEDDNADIISGSRYLDRSLQTDCPPPERRQINEIITKLIHDKLQLRLTDSFCGFKACRVSSMAKLQLQEKGYAFPLEFWAQVAYHQLRIREIPIKLIYNDPNRHFGGELDDHDTRLEHYKKVLDNALNLPPERANKPPHKIIKPFTAYRKQCEIPQNEII